MNLLLQRDDLIKQARSFNHKKRLGQHFLVDPDALSNIAAALRLNESDTVLEIGPGIGFLTHYLLASKANVIGVELDSDCVEALGLLKAPNLVIHHKDFLAFDLNSIGGVPLKIAGNVPYQITSPIIAHIFGEIDAPQLWLRSIKEIVLTIQHEVALRMVAQPGSKDYSQITLLVNYFAQAEILQVLPSANFFPPPEVNSAVIKLIPFSEPPVHCAKPRLLRQLIQAGFKQRRKMLKNNLSFLRMPEKDLLECFAELRIDPQARAENLFLKQFAQLADMIDENKTISFND